MNYYMQNGIVNGQRCQGISHVIKKGDTLYTISRIYDVSIADLIWKNPGVRIYNLQIGDVICVPVKESNNQGSKDTLPYVVREQDTLDQVLKIFSMSYEELKADNPELNIVFPQGTVLNIPSDRILRTK